MNFKRIAEDDILARVSPLGKIAQDTKVGPGTEARVRWMMGELRKASLGNISLARLEERVRTRVQAQNQKTGTDSLNDG